MPFADRRDAGRRLGDRLAHLRGADVVVLGLPRGGVPVAFEVARILDAPLDVILVRKLGVPLQPELAMGAIGEGGVRVVNEEVVRMASVTSQDLAAVEERERGELERRARRFRGDRPRISLAGRTAVVVDDGIATGSTARAACRVAKAQGATPVLLAAPVAPPSVVAELEREVEVVCVETPGHLWAIGQWYRDFTQTTDEEVATLLDRANQPAPATPDGEVEVRAGTVGLAGRLTVPDAATGLVVFAHGSGSSRHSPRNRFVAQILNQAGLGTLLFDLLTREEELDRSNVFDIELLAQRLEQATGWLREQPAALGLPIGYFGASTGAAAALWAAAQPDLDITAVVARGGRPDLAGPRLGQVGAPTLLIVGARDQKVLELNRQAQASLLCENHLSVVPDATHLFEEPGTLAVAAQLAREWLRTHLASAGPAVRPGSRAGPRQ
jgi:putative phosphoribosyl transferase